MRPAAYVLAVGLVAVAAWPARAGTILYATAASQQRIDGFCVLDKGGLAPAPTFMRATVGIEPRRLLVVRNPVGASVNEYEGVLYVAELDRVEAFGIRPEGGLKNAGSTEVLKQEQGGNNMEAVDLATSPDGTLLYVAERGPDQVAAYPIGPDGFLGEKECLTSCIQGESNADFLALVVHAGLLYVSGAGKIQGIDVFSLNADGSLPAPPENCLRSNGTSCATGSTLSTTTTTPSTSSTTTTTTRTSSTTTTTLRSEPTVPLSCRKRFQRPRGFLIDEASNILYVDDKDRSTIFAFALQPDGTFSPAPPSCTQSSQKKKEQQHPLSKTAVVAGYQSLLLSGSTLLGIQFQHGRVDAYRIKPDGRLPQRPARELADVRMTPVRGAVYPTSDHPQVLYVGGGELDRVRAFKLDSDGMLAGSSFFSQTDEQAGSFPNDVALAVLAGSCQ
jgi:6-phosphogluconolactonase (cycloisomerase 2 family)